MSIIDEFKKYTEYSFEKVSLIMDNPFSNILYCLSSLSYTFNDSKLGYILLFICSVQDKLIDLNNENGVLKLNVLDFSLNTLFVCIENILLFISILFKRFSFKVSEKSEESISFISNNNVFLPIKCVFISENHIFKHILYIENFGNFG